MGIILMLGGVTACKHIDVAQTNSRLDKPLSAHHQ